MSQIVLVAPDAQMAFVAKRVAEKNNYNDIQIIVGAIDEGVRVYKEKVKEDPIVIISRGGTALKLREAFPDIPLIDIPLSSYDWVRSFSNAKSLGENVVVAGFPHIDYSLTLDVKELLEINFKIKMVKVIVSSLKELEVELNKFKQKGFFTLIGGKAVLKHGEILGYKGVLLDSGPEAIKQALDEAYRSITLINKEKENNRRLSILISSIAEGVLAVDRKGRVTLINKAAEQILGLQQDSIGKNLADFYPNHALLDCLINKTATWGGVERYDERIVASNRVPVLIEGQVFGAVATFQEAKKLQHIEHNVRKVLSEKGFYAKHSFDKIIGASNEIINTIEKAKRMASNDSTILIIGETGCGKEVFAQSIHNLSYRKESPFVAINCAALPATLLESELFGYVDGAFTGAKKGGKTGLFEEAHKGTIFLDEISEMPISLQARLLRVLQEKEVMRLGGSRIIPIDVRIIAATNRDLHKEVLEGRFREDLYYRLNVLRLQIPPLRNREEDIILLLKYFLERKTNVHWTILDDAREILLGFEWPGNVRQVENVAERISILSQDSVVTGEDLTIALEGEANIKTCNNKDNTRLKVAELREIRKILEEVGGSKKQAAQKLGISRTTLWRKMKGLGMLQ